MTTPTRWRTTGSREVYGNRWITVSHDDVLGPDGEPGVYGVVTVRARAVFVVAVDDEDQVVLVHVDRYTTGAGWEVPAGGCDPGEDPVTAGRRELLEEAGLTATRWQVAAGVESLNGVCRAPGTVVLAQGLAVVHAQGTDAAAEGITAVRRVEWSELGAMIAAGEIRDGETLAALTAAAVALGRWG